MGGLILLKLNDVTNTLEEFKLSAIIVSAFDIDIFSHLLAKDRLTSQELADLCKAKRETVSIICDCLVHLKILELDDGIKFKLSNGWRKQLQPNYLKTKSSFINQWNEMKRWLNLSAISLGETNIPPSYEEKMFSAGDNLEGYLKGVKALAFIP